MGNLLDLFVFKYNRTDFHELNLDWLISDVITIAETLKNFISLNTIKYADPIQWNIATQYEANTVVVDPATGTAYLSTDPVPSGVALSNPDYWTVIFTLDIVSANNNITLRDDGNNVLSTFTSVIGDWLLWNGTLYKVTADIALSQPYLPGYNIERYTVELFLKDAVNNLLVMIGDLNDLSTTHKTSLVNAINEIYSMISAYDFNTVSDLIASDLSVGDIVNVLGFYSKYDGGGAFYNISTTPIGYYHTLSNGLYANMIYQYEDNILQYGAKDDDTTDITAAFQALIDSPTKRKIIPSGWFKMTGEVTITSDNIQIVGQGYDTRITYTGTDHAIIINAQRIEIDNIRIMAYTGGAFKYTGNRHGFLNIHDCHVYVFKEVLLINCEGGYDVFDHNICYKVNGASGWLIRTDTTGVTNPSLINYWTIKNNAFAGESGDSVSGIALTAMTVCDIIHNDFTSLVFGVAITATTDRCDNINIYNNEFFTCTHGVYMKSTGLCTQVSIHDNMFRCSQNCIYDDNIAAGAIRGVSIKNNSIIYDAAYGPSVKYITLHYIKDLLLGGAISSTSAYHLSNAITLTNCDLIEKPTCAIFQKLTTNATGAQAVTFDVNDYPGPMGLLIPVAYTNHSTGNAIEILDTTYNYTNGTITVNVNITSANPRTHIIKLI